MTSMREFDPGAAAMFTVRTASAAPRYTPSAVPRVVTQLCAAT
jgi:hypothetical protein